MGLQLPEAPPGARLPLRPLPGCGGQGPSAPSSAAAEGEGAAAPAGSLDGQEGAADGQGQAAQGPAVGAAGAGGPLGSARDSDTIPAVPAAPPAGEAAGLAQDPRFAPYARARLQPWLDSAEATAGGGAAAGPGAVASGAWAPAAPPGPAGPAGGSAADSLGTGPCSALDISLAGFELCVPFDREPGPCQRYAELYFKALQLVSLVGGAG